MAQKLKKGDRVIVLAGKDKRKEGIIEKVMPQSQKLLVTGINLVRDNLKPSQQNPNGGIVTKNMPIHQSKVALKDEKTGKPTRVGFAIIDGKKVRIAKKSNSAVAESKVSK